MVTKETLMFKINKSLDLNKLFGEQAKGKLLKKHITFPLYAPVKYDGNAVAIVVEKGKPTFITSGGLNYTHTDDGGEVFTRVPDAVYLAERIAGEGKLGDRNRCNLRGSKSAQTSTGHSYKVFDMIPLKDYRDGKASLCYTKRITRLELVFEELEYDHYLAGIGKLVTDMMELNDLLYLTIQDGYEGVMCINPDWLWVDTKSRKVNFCKYKKRPTVDLLVIDYKEGTGKYHGLIGSLILRDKSGRTVDVGSGMSDADRMAPPHSFIGKVVELFYEQVVDTYIQPTFGSEYEGVLIRHDKAAEDID